MDLKSEKILIAGAGISGIGAAALLGKADRAALAALMFDQFYEKQELQQQYMMGMKNLIRRQ